MTIEWNLLAQKAQSVITALSSSDEKVAKAYGLDCVFDEALEPGKDFRFRLTEADYREALHAMEAAAGAAAQ